MDISQFSKREKEVIELLLQGKSNKQIALALGVSQNTVEYHLKNIYKKLQVNSRHAFGTLRSILKQAKVSADEFIKVVK